MENEAPAQCPICQGEMTSPGTLNPCGHKFCEECLSTWLERTQMCPLCRTRGRNLQISSGSVIGLLPRTENLDNFDESDEDEEEVFLTCAVCDRGEDEFDMVNCAGCAKDFHLKCIKGNQEEQRGNEPFQCEGCSKN